MRRGQLEAPGRTGKTDESPIGYISKFDVPGCARRTAENPRMSREDCWSTDKNENQVFLIYKKIQSGAVAKSYMTNGLLISSYIWKPFLIYDFATAPL